MIGAAAALGDKPLAPGSIAIADLPRHYDVEPGVHNLENGYWGIMPASWRRNMSTRRYM
jgi:hypothetical protein